MRRLVIATNNKKKLKETLFIIGNLPFIFQTLEDINFGKKIEETGKSFFQNAMLKAETVGKITGFLTLSEDSGLLVDVLGGRPGIYSARYQEGSDSDRINKLLWELKEVPDEKRTARFLSVVAVYDPKSGKTLVFKGESLGKITNKPEGNNGFGYDPIFYNFDLGKTNAEATIFEKNKISHRARALFKAYKHLLRLSV